MFFEYQKNQRKKSKKIKKEYGLALDPLVAGHTHMGLKAKPACLACFQTFIFKKTQNKRKWQVIYCLKKNIVSLTSKTCILYTR